MSTWDAEKLLVRMREVLETGAGSLRTITSGTFVALPPGLGTNEDARRAIVPLATGDKFPVEARILSMKRSTASPSEMGNIALFDIEVEVRAVYPVVTKVTLDSATRDQVSGVAAKHGDLIAQAFGYAARNLLTTASGASTGLVSGGLSHVGTDPFEWTTVAGSGGTLTARHRFKGIAKSAPAVS